MITNKVRVIGALLLALSDASSQSVVPVSGGYGGRIGNTSLPLFCGSYVRWQQAIRASELGFVSGSIRSIALRGVPGGQSGVNRRIEVRLGYLNGGDSGVIGAVFSDNSVNSRLVFSGQVALPAPPSPGTIGTFFQISFSSTFTYDSVNGPLVLDIQSWGNASDSWFIDAHSAAPLGRAGGVSARYGTCLGPSASRRLVIRDNATMGSGGSVTLGIGCVTGGFAGISPTLITPGVPLDGLGLAGCSWYIYAPLLLPLSRVDFAEFPRFPGVGSSPFESAACNYGTAMVPLDTGLVGIAVYAQAWGSDLSRTGVGYVPIVSDVVQLKLGHHIQPDCAAVWSTTVSSMAGQRGKGFALGTRVWAQVSPIMRIGFQ